MHIFCYHEKALVYTAILNRNVVSTAFKSHFSIAHAILFYATLYCSGILTVSLENCFIIINANLTMKNIFTERFGSLLPGVCS